MKRSFETAAAIARAAVAVLASVTRWLDCFFNVWKYLKQLTLMLWQNGCQRMFKILPNTKLTLKRRPKGFKIWSNWRNFAKSGHTGVQVKASRRVIQ